MRKFLPLLLCLSLSIFTVARATKPTHSLAPDIKSTRKPPTRQQADTKTLFKHANFEEEEGSNDNDSVENASGNEGEDVNDNDTGDAAADQDDGNNNGADDNGADDNEDDDGGGGGESE
jgi:hypothetical protein